MKEMTFDCISDLQDELIASDFTTIEDFMAHKFGASWTKDSCLLELFRVLDQTMEYSSNIEEI